MIALKSLVSAFLMYSRIPMPQVEWKDENRRYALCFFPLIGAVIGAFLVLWKMLCQALDFGQILLGAGSVIIPIIVTGGIHLDGFCDVIDAKNSFGDKVKKLSILSDPHIGSFAVIYVSVYFLVQFAVMSEIESLAAEIVVAIGFVLSRSLSGIGAICFKSAKNNGSLQSFVKPAHKRITLSVLIVIAIISAFSMAYISFFSGVISVLGAALCFVFYRHFAYKNFGGITGDTAGWFLQVSELLIAILALIGERISGVF